MLDQDERELLFLALTTIQTAVIVLECVRKGKSKKLGKRRKRKKRKR